MHSGIPSFDCWKCGYKAGVTNLIKQAILHYVTALLKVEINV